MRQRRAVFLLVKPMLTFYFFATCIIFLGCSKSAVPLNSADVMFVNGCLSTSSVSVKANGISVNGATGIGFLINSGYRYVTAGSGVNLTFFNDNSGTPLANRAENLVAAAHYTAFASGDAGNPGYVFTTDDLTPPTPGNAKLRFVNLSPDNIDETGVASDSIITQGVTVKGITANTASSFYEVAAGLYFLSAFDPTNKNTVVRGDSVLIQGGKIYTVMLTGSLADSGSTSGLMLSVINNN